MSKRVVWYAHSKSLHTRPTENIAIRGVGSNQNVGGQTVNLWPTIVWFLTLWINQKLGGQMPPVILLQKQIRYFKHLLLIRNIWFLSKSLEKVRKCLLVSGTCSSGLHIVRTVVWILPAGYIPQRKLPSASSIGSLFHCVCESVVGWLIVYQFGILSLSCSQYSQTICLSWWDDNACLGVRTTE